MALTKHNCPAGEVFHVLNRRSGWADDIEKPEDYAAFLHAVAEIRDIAPLPIYATVAIPNHRHFVVLHETSDQSSEFFRRLTVLHTMRWHVHYETSGTGHLYQGRFESYPIQVRRTSTDGDAEQTTRSDR